jgi:hypothetical protein
MLIGVETLSRCSAHAQKSRLNQTRIASNELQRVTDVAGDVLWGSERLCIDSC